MVVLNGIQLILYAYTAAKNPCIVFNFQQQFFVLLAFSVTFANLYLKFQNKMNCFSCFRYRSLKLDNTALSLHILVDFKYH